MEPEHLISVFLSVNQYLKASDSQTPKTDLEEAAVTRFVSPLSLLMVPEKQGGQVQKPNGMKSNMCSENESNSQPQNIFARKEIIFI